MKQTIDIELTLINGKIYGNYIPEELKKEEQTDLFARFNVSYTEDDLEAGNCEVTKLGYVVYYDDFNKELDADEETRKKVLEYLEYNAIEIIEKENDKN
jgi:hypothetical protein